MGAWGDKAFCVDYLLSAVGLPKIVVSGKKQKHPEAEGKRRRR